MKFIKNISDATTIEYGKVTITAQNDGYLYMGIHDNHAADNAFVGDSPNVSVTLIGEE